MISHIVIRVFYSVQQLAEAMIYAGENAWSTPSNFAARFWRRLGATGLALEDLVGRVTDRCDIDLSSYMIDRAYSRAKRRIATERRST
jgi:hypothetical protein